MKAIFAGFGWFEFSLENVILMVAELDHHFSRPGIVYRRRRFGRF
jgi:hypothetical protein